MRALSGFHPNLVSGATRGLSRATSRRVSIAAGLGVVASLLLPAAVVQASGYVGSCDNGTVGYYEYYGGISASQSTTGAISGAYGDIVLGQDLNPCQTDFGKSGGLFAEGANVWGSSGVVQLGIGHHAGDILGTYFVYTPAEGGGGAERASWYPWGRVIGDNYRFYIWAVDTNPNDGQPGWQLCINDYTAGHEECQWIDRTESIQTIY